MTESREVRQELHPDRAQPPIDTSSLTKNQLPLVSDFTKYIGPLEDPGRAVPRVTVVIPSFNCVAYIEAAIRSVLAQEFQEFEIVIVDDGSSDGTSEITRALRQKYPDKIRLFEQTNSGSAVARNRGIREARGDLIAFLDADDLWFPEKLGAQVRYLDLHPEIDLVYCGWAELMHDNDSEKGFPLAARTVDPDVIDPSLSGWLYTTLLGDCVVWTSTVVARKARLLQVGDFDPDLRRGQDYDYWLRASRQTRIVKLARVMALYRIHDDSITRRPSVKNYQYEVLSKSLERWGRKSNDGRTLAWSAARRRLADTWHYYGAAQLGFGESRNAALSALRALTLWPLHRGGWRLLTQSTIDVLSALLVYRRR